MPNWDPEQYLKYSSERTQPVFDLLYRIEIDNPDRIIDLGCGPGNSTALLHQRWPEAFIEGLDYSPEMLSSAREQYPDWNWIPEDVTTWNPVESYDIIFSNSALQWVPDHTNLFPRLMTKLSDRGVLAVQMPAHFQSPVHQALVETAKTPEWQQRTAKAVASIKIERPAFYYDLLAPICSKLFLWETEYIHFIKSHSEIIDWMRGTAMRPYLESLHNDNQRERFEDQFLDKLKQSYSSQKDGMVLYPFRRLFILAYSH